MLLRFLLLVLAGIYYIVFKFHHRICLREGQPLSHAQLIVVGSYLAGGAGKTPFVAWLAQFISSNSRQVPRIAILCHSKAQDEATMLRQKFAGVSQVRVIATSNRYKTAHEIDRDYDYIICDDGFEDTRLTGATTIRLDWGEPPAGIADLLPAGKCRSLPADHDEPALALRCGADIRFEIERIVNGSDIPFNPEQHPDAAIACGIGDSNRFVRDLEANGIHSQDIIRRPDHDGNFEQTINNLLARGKPVIITEKDAARLHRDIRNNPDVYVAYQQVMVPETAKATIAGLLGL